MESIFHEKQEGSLCAQHCLNTLLQGQYFTPVDLAELAQRLDESEREHMAEAGYGTREYQQFILQPSSNYDDSGFFSIQVLQQALTVWNIELIPFNSSHPVCLRAKEDPSSSQGYVCNFREHWFTIRRIGNQWFNLNSLLTGPELFSDTHLSLFLKQLLHEGYSIFVVVGVLPPCEANDILLLMPAVQPIKPRLISEDKVKGSGTGSRSRLGSEDDVELQRALAESRRLEEEQDESLKRALEMSLIGFETSGPYSTAHSEESTPASHNVGSTGTTSQSTQSTTQVNVDEVRKRRLAFLEKNTGQNEPSALSSLSASLSKDGGQLSVTATMSELASGDVEQPTAENKPDITADDSAKE